MTKKIKRGEITTEQIVLLIVLIASFVVLTGFIVRLDIGETSEMEVCHNSVITRSSGFFAKQVIPLNCKTSYICLTRDGSCEKMTSPEVKKVKTKEEVYEALAEEGVNCWWMFGEGKAEYIGDKFTSELYCSICSQIAFDDSLENMFVVNPSSVSRANAGIPETYSNSLISREDFYKYLADTNVPGKDITYLDYFLGLKNAELISNALKTNNSNWGYIDVTKWHFVMMGEFSQVGTFQNILKGAAKGILLALVLPVPVVGGPLAMGIVVSNYYDPLHKGGNYMLGTVMTGESGHGYLSPAIIEANSEDYNQLKCADVKTLA